MDYIALPMELQLLVAQYIDPDGYYFQIEAPRATMRLALTCKHVHDHLHAVSTSNIKRATTASDYSGTLVANSEFSAFCDDKANTGTLDNYIFSVFIMPYCSRTLYLQGGSQMLLLDTLNYGKVYHGVSFDPAALNTDVEGGYNYSVIYSKYYGAKGHDGEVPSMQAWDSASTGDGAGDPFKHTPVYRRLTAFNSKWSWVTTNGDLIVVKYTLRQ